MSRAIDSLACWQRRSEGATIDRIWNAALVPETQPYSDTRNDLFSKHGAPGCDRDQR